LESDSFLFIWYLESGIPVFSASGGFAEASCIQHPESLETLTHSSDISSVMQIKFVIKYLIPPGKISFLLLILFLLASPEVESQTKTNLDVFYSLTDSLVDQINLEIPSSEKKILLTLNLGHSYSLFSNSIKERFRQNGKEILEQPPDELNVPHIDIVMEGAGVEYGDMFRDGWFGTHYIQRYAAIFGNYLQSFSETGKRDFEITRLDTVKVEDLKSLENESFPFTKGGIPSEPFLSGFAEPLIAIGTAAAVIVLFFTVRSE
jgi:hypothetical protein